jgi:hypothetical protein
VDGRDHRLPRGPGVAGADRGAREVEAREPGGVEIRPRRREDLREARPERAGAGEIAAALAGDGGLRDEAGRLVLVGGPRVGGLGAVAIARPIGPREQRAGPIDGRWLPACASRSRSSLVAATYSSSRAMVCWSAA